MSIFFVTVFKSKIKGFQEKQQLEIFIAKESEVKYLTNLAI